MKTIKIALVVMGVLIVLGFAFLSLVLYQRVTGAGHFAKPHDDSAPADAKALSIAGRLITHPTAAALGLGDDARVEAMQSVGDFMLLLIRQPRAGDRLYLIEPRTATVLSVIGVGQTVPPLPEPVIAPPPAARTPVP
ncbi:MAG: hypothetical protein WCO00_11185 [Rhodospirillaceae bacterium]